jgi:hypothetical protein
MTLLAVLLLIGVLVLQVMELNSFAALPSLWP